VLLNNINITTNENNICHYIYHLNNGNTIIPNFNITDNLIIKIYPHNTYGISLGSNQIEVNA